LAARAGNSSVLFIGDDRNAKLFINFLEKIVACFFVDCVIAIAMSETYMDSSSLARLKTMTGNLSGIVFSNTLKGEVLWNETEITTTGYLDEMSPFIVSGTSRSEIRQQ